MTGQLQVERRDCGWFRDRAEARKLSLFGPTSAKRRFVFRSRLVIAGLGMLTVGLAGVASWLLADFGALEHKSAHGAVALPDLPASALAPAPKATELPLEPRLPPLTGTENILIAGMDRRPGEKGSGLTDTLILVVLEKQTGRVGLISVPRDMAVEIPKHGLERVNAAYGLAYARGDNALSALKQSVSDLLALPIEHAMVVDLSVFESLVDAIGGITVDVPCPIIDDFVDARTPSGRRVLDVKTGQLRMDGATSAMYVRSRHGRSDFSRARRQQAVLSAIHRELLNLGNLGHITEVWTTVESHVATDLKRYELLDLARRALALKLELVHGLVFSDVEAEPRRDQGRAMLFPNLDAMDRAVAKLFSAPAPGANGNGIVCPPADIALQRKHRLQPDAGVSTGLDAGSVEPDETENATTTR